MKWSLDTPDTRVQTHRLKTTGIECGLEPANRGGRIAVGAGEGHLLLLWRQPHARMCDKRRDVG